MGDLKYIGTAIFGIVFVVSLIAFLLVFIPDIMDKSNYNVEKGASFFSNFNVGGVFLTVLVALLILVMLVVLIKFSSGGSLK